MGVEGGSAGEVPAVVVEQLRQPSPFRLVERVRVVEDPGERTPARPAGEDRLLVGGGGTAPGVEGGEKLEDGQVGVEFGPLARRGQIGLAAGPKRRGGPRPAGI